MFRNTCSIIVRLNKNTITRKLFVFIKYEEKKQPRIVPEASQTNPVYSQKSLKDLKSCKLKSMSESKQLQRLKRTNSFYCTASASCTSVHINCHSDTLFTSTTRDSHCIPRARHPILTARSRSPPPIPVNEYFSISARRNRRMQMCTFANILKT